MATTIDAISEHIVRCIERADWETLADCYAPDVLLDVDLPAWRFQLQGREVVRAYLVEHTGGLRNLRCTHHRSHLVATGLIVEEEMRFDEDEGESLWRAVDIFHVVGDAVVEHDQYCTGTWTPADVRRQAADAPMLRW